ncbi:MAG: hypothetical protein ACP5P3_00900 [Ignavibacteria bacterium]
MKTNNPLVKQIELSVQIKRVRYLNFTIIISTLLIYIAGVYTGEKNTLIEPEPLSTISMITCLVLCITSIWLKKARLKNLSGKSFLKSYFATHVVAYIMCDIAGIIGIISNTFFSFNLFYATLSMAITVVTLVITLPRESDFIFMQ